MKSLSVMVTPSIFSDVTRSMSGKHDGRLIARLLRRLSVTIISVKIEVIRLSPVLYVVKLSGSGVLVGSWDYDVSIVSILAKFITRGRRPKIRSITDVRHRANRRANDSCQSLKSTLVNTCQFTCY